MRPCSQTTRLAVAISLVGLLAMPAIAAAATMLLDFETDSDFQRLHDEGRTTLGAGKTLQRVEQFATAGRFALRFATPRWQPGLPQWPAFEIDPPVTDWSGFDRLAFDVTNIGEFPQLLALFVTDAKTPTRAGLSHQIRLAPCSHTSVVIPLAQLAEKKVNAAGIRVLHFFTAEPPGDMTVYLDRLLLLTPGEPVPSVPTSYLRDFATVALRRVDLLRATVTAARDPVSRDSQAPPALAAWTRQAWAALDRRVTVYHEAVTRGDAAMLQADQAWDSLRSDAARLQSLVAFRAGFEKIRTQVQGDAAPQPDLAVGFATSMEKVLPRQLPLAIRTAAGVELSLARNEKESFQVLVAPFEHDLRGVAIRVGELHSDDGHTLPAGAITAVPVGYVETKAVPPYGSPCVGWWPDPILEFLPAADIATGDVQSFWVRVRAPQDQSPGRYRGKLNVSVAGSPAFVFDLAVCVYPFRLPDISPLPLAVTFAPQDHPRPETRQQQAAWRESDTYPIRAWRKHKLRWADFLADYYLTYDSLYHHELPDGEVLTHLHQQGRLGKYNLGYYGQAGTQPEEVARWKTQHLPRFRAAYAQAKELGVLDHAYLYGCDEAPADLFPQVQQAAAILKAEFPDVPVMTTTYDQSYGQASVIQAMDAFCPLTPSFDPAKAAKARAAGRQVWWYICCGPHHPHANMFIEYPAIEGRLLMGAMAAKYRPDGFLYYQISIWNSQKPITNGPFTDWDPRSWTTYHGDGAWTCVGPDGTPLPTIRLENFRDGLEDFAYVRLLEAAIARVEAAPPLRSAKAAWLERAKTLLEVPTEVLTSKTEFTRDPQTLYRYRTALADAIVAASLD